MSFVLSIRVYQLQLFSLPEFVLPSAQHCHSQKTPFYHTIIETFPGGQDGFVIQFKTELLTLVLFLRCRVASHCRVGNPSEILVHLPHQCFLFQHHLLGVFSVYFEKYIFHQSLETKRATCD